MLIELLTPHLQGASYDGSKPRGEGCGNFALMRQQAEYLKMPHQLRQCSQSNPPWTHMSIEVTAEPVLHLALLSSWVYRLAVSVLQLEKLFESRCHNGPREILIGVTIMFAVTLGYRTQLGLNVIRSQSAVQTRAACPAFVAIHDSIIRIMHLFRTFLIPILLA